MNRTSFDFFDYIRLFEGEQEKICGNIRQPAVKKMVFLWFVLKFDFRLRQMMIIPAFRHLEYAPYLCSFSEFEQFAARNKEERAEASFVPRAVIFTGIQASGKSSFYKRYFQEQYVHINLDTLHTRNKERQLLDKCLECRCSFVVDNTNVSAKERARYIRPAKESGFVVEGYFFQSVLADCLERNRLRTGKACICERGIAATSNRLELPAYQEGFDGLYFVRIDHGRFIVEAWKEEK